MNPEVAALVLLGLAEVPQVMSAFLPSPTTAYMGGAHPERVAMLRRGEIIGSAVSLSIAAAVSLIASKTAGAKAWWVFFGAIIVLVIFLFEYERALRLGEYERNYEAPKMPSY